MDSAVFNLSMGVLAITYILLTVQKKNGLWLFSAVLFSITAAFVRYFVGIDEVRDFTPYFNSFLAVKYGTVPTELLFEPYRLAIFQLVMLFGDMDAKAQIAVIYYFHFVVVTAFFLWLAYFKEASFEAKVILFLAFYPTMAFVWIRSGMAYAAACFLFLSVTQGRARILHYMLPLIHSSVIPLVVALKIKDLTAIRKALIIAASFVVGYFVLESSYAQYIIYKLERYSETDALRTSFDLLLFHAANILVFIYLALINSWFRKNFAVMVLMGTYMAMYFVNPVMGLRVFPLVLIASLVQRIPFPRYQLLTLVISTAYLPIYFGRFDQIII